MSTVPFSRRIGIAVGGAALVIVGTLTACSPSKEKEAPSSTTSTPAPTTSTTAPSPSPTEKAMLPGGDQSFSPTVNPAPPGPVCKEVVGGVCIR